MAYVVAVKPSARRVNAAAGEHVRDHGPRKRFDSRAAAAAWAEDLSADGTATVYVRDANPGDDDADGYLMALRHRGEGDDEPGEQAPIPAFDPDSRSDDARAGLERSGDL